MTVSVFAPAKINLTLHVTGQRSDGYHKLDSFVVFPLIGDHVHVSQSDRLNLKITGKQATTLSPDADNLVLRAARLLDPKGCADIVLEKRLPIAAGIGGGSADAAATLHALDKLWGSASPSISDMMKLGADVPVCHHGGSARMRGAGEELTPLAKMPDYMGILLVNPGVEVHTPEVFHGLNTRSNAPMPAQIPEFETAPDLCNWLKLQRNDLEESAIKIAPVIQTVLDDIEKSDCLIARMSGSGATCFGLYETQYEAKAALKSIQSDQPNWWAVSSGFSHPRSDIS